MQNQVTNFQNNYNGFIYILSLTKLLSRIFRIKTVKFDYICPYFINDHIGGNCWKMFLYVTITEIRRTVLMLSNKYYQLFQDWIINPEIRRKKMSKKLEKDWTKTIKKMPENRRQTEKIRKILIKLMRFN